MTEKLLIRTYKQKQKLFKLLKEPKLLKDVSYHGKSTVSEEVKMNRSVDFASFSKTGQSVAHINRYRIFTLRDYIYLGRCISLTSDSPA